jgi:hypothetical protein
MPINLSLGRENDFDVDIHITGLSESVSADPRVTMTIDAGAYSIGLPARRIGIGKYSVSAPVLEGILPEGEHDMRVEVVIDGRHFVPITDTVRARPDPRATSATVRESSVPMPRKKPAVAAALTESRQDPPKPRRTLARAGTITA